MRLPLFLAALAASGVVGGVAGGAVVATTLREASRPGVAATEASPGASATASPGSTGASELTALQAAIDRTLPAIVTIIADQPERGTGDAAVQTRSLGSGIVIDDSGHVLTNYHVVDGAQTVMVALATGEQRPARYIGDDSPFSDMAVLQIPSAGLRSTRLVSSRDVRLGEPVLALGGSAIAGQNSATFGIVSGVRRQWARPGVNLEDLIQTDAAVNHGDSGGALLTRAGIVGLLTTVVRETPNGLTIDGVSFAQSTDSLRAPLDEILRTGRSQRARLGIERFSQHQEITPGLAARESLASPQGALVRVVASGSPAEVAGVRPGDIVVGVNGTQVDLVTPMVNLLKALKPGERAELAILRAGQPLRLSVQTAAG